MLSLSDQNYLDKQLRLSYALCIQVFKQTIQIVVRMNNNEDLALFIAFELTALLSNQQVKSISVSDPEIDGQRKLRIGVRNDKEKWILDEKSQSIYVQFENKKYSLKLIESQVQSQNALLGPNQEQSQNGFQMFNQLQQQQISPEQLFELRKNQRLLKQSLVQKFRLIQKLQSDIQTLKNTNNNSKKAYYHNISTNNQKDRQPDNQAEKQTNRDTKIQIPDPILFAPIEFYDQEKHVKYTDCWEISVLRFLHLIFGQGGTISQSKLTAFMDLQNKNCKQLIHYFSENPTYHLQQSFYTTKEGFDIRSKWCQFLNKSKLMKLKIDKKYEVAATIPNLIAFYRGYFPKIKINQIDEMSYENILTRQLFQSYEMILRQIYCQFSGVAQFSIEMKLHSNIEYYVQDYIYFSLVQKISLGNERNHQLEWQIYEYYTLTESKTIGQRMMGHSDYRYNQQSTKRIQELKQIEEFETQLRSLKQK